MLKSLRLLCGLLLVGLVALFSPAPATAQAFNETQRAELRALIREYLVRNPEVLDEALVALQDHRQAEAVRRMTGDARDPSVGPRNASVTVVEFFDYRCPACHEAAEWVDQVTRTRGNQVRIIFKEWPILGPNSQEASRAALAAQRQGRYLPFHLAMMQHRGQLTSQVIDTLARGAGIDVARMRRDMAEPGIRAHMDEVQNLSRDLGLSGTPTFMINGEPVQLRGDQPLVDTMNQAVDAALAASRRR